MADNIFDSVPICQENKWLLAQNIKRTIISKLIYKRIFFGVRAGGINQNKFLGRNIVVNSLDIFNQDYQISFDENRLLSNKVVVSCSNIHKSNESRNHHVQQLSCKENQLSKTVCESKLDSD